MKLLITGAWKGADKHMDRLKELGQEVLFLQYEKSGLPCSYGWPEGVICNGLFLYHPIEKFSNLKYIQLTSAGFDRIPMKYVKEKGIKIYNARGVYSVPMAEYAVGAVLQIYKQSAFFYENQKKRHWEKHRGLKELFGKTVCVVGCGSVGTECAKRFRAFGCRVLGVDLFPGKNENYQKIVPMENLPEILPQTDILILTLPLTEETRHMIGEKALFLLKKGAVFVNLARGALVKEKALEYAMEKHLGGAVLDVFEEEPLRENSPFWDRENVILTPHNSFVGEGNSSRLDALILENIKETNDESSFDSHGAKSHLPIS